MELRQLRHFVEVVRQGSINTAATALGITQPGVTRSIKKLEVHFGANLLNRNARGVTPTAAGRMVYEHAVFVLNESERVAGEVSAVESGHLGRVSVGVSTNFLNHYMPAAVARLLRSSKDVAVSIREGYFEDLTPALRLGELDLIFSIFPAYYTEPDLAYEPLMEVKSYIYGRAGHPLAQGPVTRAQLSAADWVFADQKHVTRFKDMFFAKHELPIPASRVTAKSLQAICALLPDTDLIALLPEYVVRDDVAAKRLVRIPYQQIVLTNKAGLVTTKGRQATGAAAVLAKALRQVCRQRA